MEPVIRAECLWCLCEHRYFLYSDTTWRKLARAANGTHQHPVFRFFSRLLVTRVHTVLFKSWEVLEIYQEDAGV